MKEFSCRGEICEFSFLYFITLIATMSNVSGVLFVVTIVTLVVNSIAVSNPLGIREESKLVDAEFYRKAQLLADDSLDFVVERLKKDKGFSDEVAETAKLSFQRWMR
jgi:hypothetical protein